MLSQLTQAFRAFIANCRGSITIIAAISAPAMFAVLAVASDYAVMSSLKNRLQAAADAAALASVKELGLSGASEKQIKATASNFVYTNLDEKPGDNPLSVEIEIEKKDRTVDVTLVQTWTPFFLHFVSDQVTPIKANARAQTVGPRLACVLGLSKLLPPGVQLWKDARLTADGCDVYSNTELPLGLVVNDNSSLKAELICVSGGYVAMSPKSVEPQPTTDCPAFPDPLASRTPPKVGPCDHLLKIVLNQNVTLNPGVYCGGLTILGNSKVKLNPGIYVINNGLFTVAGTASLTGENVGFYLAGLVTLMILDSNTTIDLTAPESGPLAGILFFEDRNVPPLRIHRIGSNNARNLVGTIYLPLGILLIDASAPVADKSAYTAIIANSLQLREGPELVLRSDYDSTDVPVPDGLINGRVFLIQ